MIVIIFICDVQKQRVTDDIRDGGNHAALYARIKYKLIVTINMLIRAFKSCNTIVLSSELQNIE